MSNVGISGGAAAETLERHPMLDLLDEGADSYLEFQRGDVVNGTIAWVGENEILIDVGGKFEGILASHEFSQMPADQRRSFEVGNVVECLVLNPRDRNGNLVLSLSQARIGQDWDLAEEYFREGTVFEAPVGGHNKGGLIVYVGQVRGFVPASQIDRRHAVDRSRIDGTPASPLAALVDEPLWFRIMEIDRRKNRLILSEQAAMRERRKQLKTDLLGNLEEGQVVEGSVTSLADFGAFVDIGGADGLIHLSEISWNRVSNPRDVLELHQIVTVKVIAVDRERKRIGLSLKQLEPEPWSTVADAFVVGSVVEGTISRLADFGAFAKLEGNIEGLIHVSELSDDARPPAEVVSPGDVLQLRVIRVDPKNKRIGLSLKRAAPEYDDLPLSHVAAAAVAEQVVPAAEAEGTESEGIEAEGTENAGGPDLATDVRDTDVRDADAPNADVPSEGPAAADEEPISEASVLEG